ncbi:MAG TPA: FRG domain-containing protein [Kiritimatiellia bacterium]|jgi:hypothetical protein|nr:MAG: FRG domain protein [Verrucomicrobia bacterium ADurb.Bin018]HOE00018.1 FRG domain-containing protein [Kiritimatiellia bacterium]HOE36318.1 FRG domain-containing protein [Kiritimatiellia bacterium]HOR73922.1 FRG domain-containing protein [Kiritimatiellia bacterium]HOU58326.1 FRG domain-containing protein [Kiritimatiellia bacterium]
MLTTIQISSWPDFLEAIQHTQNQYGTFKRGDFVQHPTILYRGQANAEWTLATTLERISQSQWSLERYARLAYRCAPQIEAMTGRSWDMPKWETFEKALSNIYDNHWVRMPLYNFCVYLRHHGFPSPLLDWTTSPYIAAYFALESNVEADAAIYVFIERPQGGKLLDGASCAVHTQGPYISTHKRHFLQQCFYTIASKCDPEQKTVWIMPHESILKLKRPDQDIFIKYVLPKKLRFEALEYLQAHNITHYSLFQSDEALMRTLAFQEIERHEKEAEKRPVL